MLAADFFALPPSLAPFAAQFRADVAPWDWLNRIAAALGQLPPPAAPRAVPPGVHIEGAVWIDPSVKLPAYATIIGPAWIGAKTEIRPGAYIRGNVIVGEGCVLGNACEFKNCLLLDGVQVPHFSYVGDSILGNRAHLGAGSRLAPRVDRTASTRIDDLGDVPSTTGISSLEAIADACTHIDGYVSSRRRERQRRRGRRHPIVRLLVLRRVD
jgi:NDP-sugar pyrophosphorylase family protein